MKIVDLGINGEGIARQDGKVYFVKGALVGEEVSVKGVSDKKREKFKKVIHKGYC